MNILDLRHVIIHPLSILIHLQFQDKDGCSRNGSREFLFDSHIVENERELQKGLINQLIIVDYRGVPFYLDTIELKSSPIFDDERGLNFRCVIFARSKLNQEENQTMIQLKEHKRLHPPGSIDPWDLNKNSGDWKGVHSINGFVNSIYPFSSGFEFCEDFCSTLSNLPHLKSFQPILRFHDELEIGVFLQSPFLTQLVELFLSTHFRDGSDMSVSILSPISSLINLSSLNLEISALSLK